MGRRGPKPAPEAVKALRGDKPSRRNPSAPKPAETDVVPTRPIDGYALEVWKRLAPDLIAKKVLTAWDADAFTSYCQWSAVEKDALDDIAARGNLVDGFRNSKVKNPSMQIARDAGQQLIAIGARFGLTPSDRGQLRLGKGSGGRKGDDLLT